MFPQNLSKTEGIKGENDIVRLLDCEKENPIDLTICTSGKQ